MAMMNVRHLHKQRGRWYWIPSRSAHALGFRSKPLGADLHAARTEAERLNAQLDAERKKLAGPKSEKGTVATLIAKYRASDNFRNLAPETRNGYDYRLRGIEKNAGKIQVASITRKQLVQLYERLKESKPATMAASIMRVWRVLMRYAYNTGEHEQDLAGHLNIRSTPSRGTVWMPEEVNELISVAIANGKPSVALAVKLAYSSGQRPTDVLRLSWSQWEGSGFWVKQSKTGERVFAPVSPRLAIELNSMTKEGLYLVLAEGSKRPYRRPHFSREFAGIRSLAQLDGQLQFRDLRRTVATELGSAGATDDELRAVTGHRSRSVVSVYVRPNRAMSEAGQRKRFGNSESKSGKGEV